MDKNSHNTENDINISQLIEKARNLTSQSEWAESEYLLNLALLSPNIDYSDKITALAIKSFIGLKTESESTLLRIANKMLKEMKNIKNNSNAEIGTYGSYIRTCYRIASFLMNKKKNYFLAGYFFYRANQFINSTSALNGQEIKEDIERNFIQALDQINSKLIFEKERYIKESNSQNKDLNEIKNYFLSENSNENLNGNNFDHIKEGEEKIYLVSAIYINNMCKFLSRVDNFHDKMFDKRNVVLLYYNNGSNKEEYKRYLGSYPGPINNFFITDYKDYWYDNNKDMQYTNVFLKKDVKENSDFIYLNEKIYKHIKSYFGGEIDIERKVLQTNSTTESCSFIEIHLRRIKILVLSTVLLNGHKQYIRPRFIQISKTASLLDLKTKIVRCLYDLTKNKNLSRNVDIKLYNPELTKKELFEIVHAYNNKFSTFKIKGEEILDENSLKIENLKLAAKDIIIVEVKVENETRKGWFINLRNEKLENITCSLCEDHINVSNKVTCDSCNQFVYCSQRCKELDDIHIHYHKNIDQLYKKKFNVNELASININDFLNKNSRGGLTGLKNLGNTCFMNSALQCLSNCEELTKYFLLNKFAEEINKKNKYGSGGQIAKAYYELIKELWLGSSPYLSPWDFRQIFVGFVKQFAGFCQHDSHEMLAFMLDALHEDLNRVKDKPYFELKEKLNDESEEQASARWWQSHLSRENSIIVDLFHGQYKSVIKCPQCNRISITYDPFMYLGLPIPAGQCKIVFKFFPCLINVDPYQHMEIEMSINENTTILDMKNKIINAYGEYNNGKFIYLEAIAAHNKFYKKRLTDEFNPLSYYEHGNEIVIYEIENNIKTTEEYVPFYCTPMIFTEERSYLVMKSQVPQALFYTKPFVLHRNQTVRDLYFTIFKYYRKLFQDKITEDGQSRTYEKFIKNLHINPDYIRDEFIHYFNNKDIPFKLHIINNMPDNGSYYGGKSYCEFCNKSCDYCQFAFDLDKDIDYVKNTQNKKRPFLIYVEILKYNGNNLFDKIDIKESHQGIFSHKGNVNIYDCLDAFRSEEKLEKDNAWYCNICKEHQEAYKKLEIYRPPNVLIIQFKRFKIKTNNVMLGMIANKKNDCLIDFPVDDLDIKNYIVSDIGKEDAVYELFAISQHYGSLSSGHYTALCRRKNKWFDFDDERVSHASDDHIVTPAAYLLFYRKKMFK